VQSGEFTVKLYKTQNVNKPLIESPGGQFIKYNFTASQTVYIQVYGREDSFFTISASNGSFGII